GQTLSPETMLHLEAVRLFVERAAAVAPGFDLTPDNALAIGQICTRLDGIPLAIELAAGRGKMPRPEKIAGRLNDTFPLLSRGSRTALPRQQTLRAAMDWSYNLLAPKEHAALRRLAVFAGGWTLEAAEALVADGDQIESGDVLELLAQLVNKSLVQAEPGPA